jgi:hypothetical protein
MVHVDQQTGTVFLNAATVPRVVMQPMRGESDTRPAAVNCSMAETEAEQVAGSTSGRQYKWQAVHANKSEGCQGVPGNKQHIAAMLDDGRFLGIGCGTVGSAGFTKALLHVAVHFIMFVYHRAAG